jgi:TP901 family phage tail tape measure protein
MAIGGGLVLQRAASQMQPSLDFESRLRDIAITGGFSRVQEGALGTQVMADAKRWGQFTNVISDGLAVLVANGITASSELQYYSGLLAKSSVATGGEMQDLGNLVVTLQKNLGIAKDGIGGALDSLAYAGKQGSFELRDMAKWMPQLTPQMSALGVSGRAAVDELGAALQIARLGAGTSDEAANNLRNYLSKIVAPDTIKNFADAGIDLQKRLMEMRARGVTPLQGSLQLVSEYMGKKGPEAAKKLQKALALKDDEQRQAALEQLASAYALGDLFRDAQAMAFLRPALANGGQMASIQSGASSASGGIDKDWAARMATGQKQVDLFNIRMDELKLKAGALLLPTLNQLAQSVGGLLDRFSAFASAHPQLTAGLIKLAIAGVAVITALGGLLVVAGTSIMMLGNVHSAVMLLSGGRGLLGLARVFPIVATGLRVIGAAAIANPIGLVVTLLAGAAYLIWQNWDRIGPLLSGIWTTVTGAVGQAWDWLKGKAGALWDFLKAAFAWSPLGLIITHWDGVLGFLGGLWTRFKAIGGQLMQGLIGGLLGGLKAVGDTITGIGTKVVDWFKGKLGIRSPSRVFAQLGGYTMQGLAGGLQRGQGAPLGQIDTLAQRMKRAGAGIAIAAAASPAFAADTRAVNAPRAATAAAAPPSRVYHITIQGAGMDAQAIAQEVRRQLDERDRQANARMRSRLGDYD